MAIQSDEYADADADAEDDADPDDADADDADDEKELVSRSILSITPILWLQSGLTRNSLSSFSDGFSFYIYLIYLDHIKSLVFFIFF